MKSIAVFVPVYNEEGIVEKNIKKLYHEIKKLSSCFEIILVDDGSKDSTPKILKKLAKKFKEIRYQRYDSGPSRRENLAEAMKKSDRDIIVFTDVDLSVGPEYLKKLIGEIKKGADISTGSRYRGISAKRTLFRRALSICYNKFLRIYFKSRIMDHQCGFKAYKREVIQGLINEAGYDKKFVRGWFWDAEILLRAQKRGYKITEFPVRWIMGKESSFCFRREIKMIRYVLELKKRL